VKFLVFLLFGAAQAALVILVYVQTGDQVAAIVVAVAAVFFQLVIAFAAGVI
jgi:hypothetical protein